jgi:Cu-Zn family superoxide dismutase
MKFSLIPAALLSFALVAATSPRALSQSKTVSVHFKNPEGKSVGTATLSPAPSGVRLKLDIKDLPPGEHSIHIHQVAKCEPPDFKSAGPHFGAAHAGYDHGAAAAGDIPNFSLIVGADGTAHVTVIAPNVNMDDNAENSIFSNGGTSIVIHAVTDTAAPTAPARIACGIVSKPA